MKVIGITGGTGAGKSTLCAELEKCGAQVIDADSISRQVTKSDGVAFNEIAEAFGNDIIAPDGELDRKALANVVFNDAAKLKLLNKITHKHIFEQMKSQLDACAAKVAVLDVPLLFEDDFPFRCDLTVAVLAKPEVRLERIMKRDKISKNAAAERIKNQMTDEQYKDKADVCFVNNGDVERIREFAKTICEI